MFPCKGLLIAVAVGVIGCGETDRGRVTGTLQRADGQPLVGARVIARSADGAVSASGHTDSAGRFQLGMAEHGDGVPPGEYELTIVEDRGDRDHRKPPTIASKYRDPATSDLRVTVESGEEAVIEAKLDPP